MYCTAKSHAGGHTDVGVHLLARISLVLSEVRITDSEQVFFTWLSKCMGK